MSFSDEDLKRLKDLAYDYRDGSRFMWIKGPEIVALIARLEAAEAVLLEIERFNNGILTDTSEFRAWRKAAGK